MTTMLNETFCLDNPSDEISPIECLVSRTVGWIMVFVSIFSLAFNLRFIHWSATHRHIRSRQYPVLVSMIFSSFSVTLVISPSVFIQCLTCVRWCAPYYCRFEGFINYLNGCVHMFLLMMISILRYSTVVNSKTDKRSFHSQSHLAVLLCWFFGLVFALPPLFKLNEYIPEGIGFHCGLNWFERSFSSRLYFCFMFLFVYFIPLIVLFAVNIHIYCLIRRLLRRTVDLTKSVVMLKVSEQKYPHSTSFGPSLTTGRSTSHSEKFGFIFSTNSVYGNTRYIVRHTTNSLQIQNLVRLNRLQADRRFALATIFLVSEYILSWTPYAILALFYLFDSPYVNQNSILMTIFAYTAKISMMLNPFVYIATVNTNQLESILRCKSCTCSHCHGKRNQQTL